MSYHAIFEPKSIAVIGASSNPSKPGGRIIKNIKEHDYQGILQAVNPKSPDIMGLPTFKSIEDLPAPPELAFIAVAAPYVRPALEGLVKKGTKGVIALSCGFGEIDEKGKEEEERLVQIANQAGITLLGPNCMGVLTPTYAGIFAGPIPRMKPQAVDIISGSGATAAFIIEQAVEKGLTVSSLVTVGNSAQKGVEDILQMHDEHFGPGSAKIKALYLESIARPQKLLKHAASLIRKGCMIVAIKAGSTAAGSKAASSHTGAMASSDTAVDALFDKAGIIRVKSKMELIDTAGLLLTTGPISGKNACIITHAGGPGVMLADELSRQGFDIPPLDEKVQNELRKVLQPGSAVGNPVDFLASGTPKELAAIYDIIGREQNGKFDFMPTIFGCPGLFDVWEPYQVIARAIDNCPIPVIPVLPSPTTATEATQKFKDTGKFYFSEEVNLGAALGRVVHRPMAAGSPNEVPKNYQKQAIEQILKDEKDILCPEKLEKVLMAAGFPLPPQKEIYDMRNIDQVVSEMGFPLAMKVIGPLHKSDAGGVILDIESMEQAKNAADRLLKIDTARGVLLQKMVCGTEVIMGLVKEPGFGHLIMFGLGGIYTEVLCDVKFALAPLSEREAINMIEGIKGYKILAGIRGQQGISVPALADCLMRLGALAADFPQIEEMDINPLKGQGDLIYAVDARMELAG